MGNEGKMIEKILFGQKVLVDENNVHTYADTGEEVKFFPNGCINAEQRQCPHCNLTQSDGIDPCLGRLPGVRAACCGHGVKDGYIAFTNHTSIKIKIFSICKDMDDDEKRKFIEFDKKDSLRY